MISGVNAEKTFEETKEYYGKILQKSEDLKTNACCTEESPPAHVIKAMKKINPEVLGRYYGCGLILPDALEGCSVLDLGCGAGRDVYMLSQFVGESGKVIGVDMTKEQLEVARKHEEFHREAFGFAKSNVTFLEGYMEDLAVAGVADNSVDVIVSNCVVNLSPDKPKVLREAFRVLKEGGEFYFSDVYASRRVPPELMEDPELWGECLSGALYWNDFERMAREAGFGDPRLVKDSKITVENKRLEAAIGGRVEFYSATYRLFKLPGLLEPDCEDYGQAIVYKGTIPNSPYFWDLDNHHRMELNKVFPVCANTHHMVHDTRFKSHFSYLGDKSTHFGIFDGCGKTIPYASAAGAAASCC